MSQQSVTTEGVNIILQGRMLWGGVKPSTVRNFQTKQPVLDDKGQEQKEWVFGLGIPKITQMSSEPEKQNFMTFWNAVYGEAAKIGIQQANTAFHWKFEDGDGLKSDGTAFPEHYKGFYVLTCKTRVPLKVMVWEGQQCRQAMDDEVKCGYFVQVALNIKAHSGVNAGLYVNPSFVARFAFGPEIINAPSATDVLGSAPPPMFAGASATPVGNIGAPPVNGFGGPAAPAQFGGMPGQAPQGNAFNVQSPAAPPNFGGAPQTFGNNPQVPNGGQGFAPNHNVLPGQFQPQAQQGGMAPHGNGVPQGNAMNAQGVANGYNPMGQFPGSNAPAQTFGNAPMGASPGNGGGGYGFNGPQGYGQ